MDDQENKYVFGGSEHRTKGGFQSEHAVLLDAADKYGFATSLRVVADEFYQITVWRKSKNDIGVIVAASETPGLFYEKSAPTILEQQGEWQKIGLEVMVPPHLLYPELKVYVWNPSSDSVWFDDLHIVRRLKKKYPEYEVPYLELSIGNEEINVLKGVRKRAFQARILESTDRDWIKGMVYDGEQIMSAKMRLKGDWLDHLKGDKWSYRIKLKDDFVWNELKVFSIQTPISRDFLSEWLAHELFTQQGVLTTKYGFVPVKINDRHMGLFAWEEHFVKQLVESRYRREGPILKFNEDGFWKIQKFGKLHKDSLLYLPDYQSALIEPFSMNKTMKTEHLKQQFVIAQTLLEQYRLGSKKVSDIFDVDKLAKYYALMDLTNARHGLIWHNMRFYYNPIISKLEPIAYDGYTSGGVLDWVKVPAIGAFSLEHNDSLSGKNMIVLQILKDEKFINSYINYLVMYSNDDFIRGFYSSYQEQISQYEALVQKEFPYYQFDNTYYFKRAEKIRNLIPGIVEKFEELGSWESLNIQMKEEKISKVYVEEAPPKFVNIFTQDTLNDSANVLIQNFYPLPIKILGASSSKKYIQQYLEEPVTINAYDGVPTEKEMRIIGSAKYLHFIVDDNLIAEHGVINAWKAPLPRTPRQQMEDRMVNYQPFQKNDNGDYYLASGDYTINKDMMFPEGSKLIIQKGVEINLLNHAAVIVQGALEIQGTASKPVRIFSEDSTGQGVTVLQANSKSTLSHVQFKQLTALNKEGWTQTGSVNFYESKVEINNCSFISNQCEDALNTIRTEFLVSNCSFENIYGDAFDSDFCQGRVINCAFSDVGNDAIDFSGSYAYISNVNIVECGDKAISGGEASKLDVEEVQIEKCKIAVASKDASRVDISRSEINNVAYGAVVFRKKPEYAFPDLRLTEVTMTNVDTLNQIEEGSTMFINDVLQESNATEVAKLFY